MEHKLFTVDLRGTKKVSRQVFDGTNELAKYLKKAPVNKIWEYESCYSNQSKEDDFNDFDNLEDAIEALEYGTEIYYEDFKKNVKKVQDFINKREINKKANYKNDRVGFLPIVPKVLQGNPINMINQDIKPKPYPTATIVLEKSNSCGVKPADMNKFYSIVFVLIQILENRGVRCELWITDNSYNGGEIVSLKTKLKSYTQPLNVYKIQFPIIASDFHRRIFFRIKETNPDIETDWTGSYGCPLTSEFDLERHEKEIKNVIGLNDNDIYIPSCQEFGYRAKDDLDETIQKIIDRTNLKNYIKLSE